MNELRTILRNAKMDSEGDRETLKYRLKNLFLTNIKIDKSVKLMTIETILLLNERKIGKIHCI